MAEEMRQRLTTLRVKSEMLTRRYQALARQLTQARERIDELEAELSRSRSEQRRLQQQAELMRASSLISPTREDVARTRVMLSEMLREIDKCIEQLTY